MAATLTHTSRGRIPAVHTLAWVSHTDGTVSLATSAMHGEIQRVVFKPDAGGTAPSANYDVTLLDADGADVLGGQGGNLHESNVLSVCPGVPLKDGTTTSVRSVVVSGTLTLNVTNAGSGKGGTIRIYLR